MTRVKRGTTVHRRHQKVLKATKGYRGQRSKIFKSAKNAMMKAGLRSYKDRRLKKRTFRGLWIVRINAGCRPFGINYSRLVEAMTKKGIAINRKMLAELAANEPVVFKAVVEAAK